MLNFVLKIARVFAGARKTVNYNPATSGSLCEAAMFSEYKISFQILLLCVTRLVYVCVYNLRI